MEHSGTSTSTSRSGPNGSDSELGLTDISLRPTRRVSRQLYSVLRWLHVYVSMLSFRAILFFAITGITLNHPEWTLGLT